MTRGTPRGRGTTAAGRAESGAALRPADGEHDGATRTVRAYGPCGAGRMQR